MISMFMYYLIDVLSASVARCNCDPVIVRAFHVYALLNMRSSIISNILLSTVVSNFLAKSLSVDSSLSKSPLFRIAGLGGGPLQSTYVKLVFTIFDKTF